MSLPALALLVTAAGALQEVAPPWLRVEMAPREPLTLAADGDERVLVAVFTGDEVQAHSGRRWYDGTHTIELAVQVLLPPLVTASVGSVSRRYETHRAGAEPVFAAVQRLMERAFTAPARGSWGELWQTLVVGHDGDLERRPFIAELKGGVQLPAADYSIPCRTLSSPPFGSTVAGFWPDLVAKLRTTPDMASIADFVEALIKGDVPVSPWRAEQVRAGLSRREGEALGVGGFVDLNDEAPLAVGLTIKSERSTTRVSDEGGA